MEVSIISQNFKYNIIFDRFFFFFPLDINLQIVIHEENNLICQYRINTQISKNYFKIHLNKIS